MSATHYQPVHINGTRGPILPHATDASFWIIEQDDFYAWHWEPVHAPKKPVEDHSDEQAPVPTSRVPLTGLAAVLFDIGLSGLRPNDY